MSEAAAALGEFILGLPLEPLVMAHLHEKAQAAILEAAEQTAALRAGIIRLEGERMGAGYERPQWLSELLAATRVAP